VGVCGKLLGLGYVVVFVGEEVADCGVYGEVEDKGWEDALECRDDWEEALKSEDGVEDGWADM
jgi:hypothetical protein